ncbi:MAG TPA: hypothetical protein VF269_03275 [Rhodanobacteraceae bacterium]
MIGWIFLAGTVIATVFAQLAFKKFHLVHHKFYLVAAITLFCLVVPCTYLAVRQLGIGRVYIGAALAYVITPLAACKAFGEELTRSQMAALGLILAGVITYNL